MFFVSHCIKTLKVPPKCDSIKRQKFGLDFAVPFNQVCLHAMENISITQF